MWSEKKRATRQRQNVCHCNQSVRPWARPLPSAHLKAWWRTPDKGEKLTHEGSRERSSSRISYALFFFFQEIFLFQRKKEENRVLDVPTFNYRAGNPINVHCEVSISYLSNYTYFRFPSQNARDQIKN